jgi:hypothetical protein
MNAIAAISPEDLRKAWEVFPLLTVQRAGGPSTRAYLAKITPGADVKALILHCAVLQATTEPDDHIDFEQAGKAIPLPMRSQNEGVTTSGYCTG